MKLNIPSKYIKANLNVKQGDIVKLLNEGEMVPGTGYDGKPVEKLEFNCELPNGETKIFTMNISNQKLLINEWGDDTANWVNKPLEVVIEKKIIGVNLRYIVSLVPTDKKADKFADISVVEEEVEF